MKTVLIYGAGGTGRHVYQRYLANPMVNVLAFVDTYKTGDYCGLSIIKPDQLKDYEFDEICIATVHAEIVEKELKRQKIGNSKIVFAEEISQIDARIMFVEKLSEEIKRKKLEGNVAEAGVFRGDFSKEINRCFPDKWLYLFDTFTGFDDRDIVFESNYDTDPRKGEYFKNTSVDIVMSKMPHRERIIIKQGYVPESFKGIDDTFCFVNLDMDLYKPTMEALKWFYPRIVEGGGILIHDYFDKYNYLDLKKGVIEFCENTGAKSFPIGDRLSIFIVK